MWRSPTEEQDGYCCVIGPACCGTRLLTRLIEESRTWTVFHDTSHGIKIWPNVTKPIIITRNKTCANLSAKSHHSGKIPTYEDSIYHINLNYPNVLRVTYEQLVEDSKETISYIAEYLKVSPWNPSEKIFHGNLKYSILARK